MRPWRILPALIFGLFLAAACGETEQPLEHSPYGDANVHSGSRLRARWLVAEDARQPAGWYDTKLDTPCDFDELSDGYRCIPSEVGVGYLDAACTQRVAFGAPNPKPGLHSVKRYGSGLCGSIPEVELVRLGEGMPAPSEVYANPGCSPIVGDIPQVYPITGEVPLSSTVSARLIREPLDPRIERTLLVSDDGAQASLRLYDPQLGSSAYVEEGVLAPAAAEIFIGYADADCTEPLRPVANSSCPSKFGALETVTEDGCPAEKRYFRMATTKTDIVHAKVWGYCSPIDSSWYEVGEELPRTQLASVATELTGEGRIQALVARASDSGASLGTSAWVDSRWGTKCVVYPDEDNNSYRCIPRNEPAQVSFNQFRDPDCSIPLAIPSACGDVHLVWDPSHDAVYEVQGVEQLTQAYSVVDGVCTAEAQAEFDNYVLSPLTLDDFVEFHEVIE